MTAAARLKRRSVRLNEEVVETLMKDCTHQGDALVALYKMVFPDWDELVDIKGWPSVNDFTWKAIATLFVALDTNHHPDVFAGGLWLNRGFSTAHGEKLQNWEVSLVGVSVTRS